MTVCNSTGYQVATLVRNKKISNPPSRNPSDTNITFRQAATGLEYEMFHIKKNEM